MALRLLNWVATSFFPLSAGRQSPTPHSACAPREAVARRPPTCLCDRAFWDLGIWDPGIRGSGDLGIWDLGFAEIRKAPQFLKFSNSQIPVRMSTSCDCPKTDAQYVVSRCLTNEHASLILVRRNRHGAPGPNIPALARTPPAFRRSVTGLSNTASTIVSGAGTRSPSVEGT